MKRSALLFLIVLPACSPPLPSAAETQIAIEQFYARSHPRDPTGRPFIVRCAPITYFRPFGNGAMVLFGEVTPDKVASGGIWLEMDRPDGNSWRAIYKGPIKDLPCEYLPVAMDGMGAISSGDNAAAADRQKSLTPNRATP